MGALGLDNMLPPVADAANRLLAPVALALVVAVTSAAPARGEDRVIGQAASLTSGPALAGAGLLFEERTTSRFAVRLVSPGAPARALARGRLPTASEDPGSPGDYSSREIELAASATRAAYSDSYAHGNARYAIGSTGTSLFTGPLTGPLAQVATCSGGLYPPFSGAVAVDADAVAHVGCEGALVVRNFAPGAAVPLRTLPQPAGSHVTGVALAGRYVAYRRATTGPVPRQWDATVVADWLTGSTAYSLPPEDDFDLDANGNLVVAKFEGGASCAAGRLSWYSISEPRAHPLAQAPCRPGVRIANGAIAAVFDAGRLGRALGVVDLAGRRRDLAVVGPEGVQRGDIDFDGSRLSYALRDCSGAADLRVVDVTSAAGGKPLATSCPVLIRSRRLLLRPRSRSVKASIACPRGCAGRARLERRVRRGRRTRAITLGSSRRFGFGALRCRPAVAITLNRNGRRLMRGSRRLRARLVISTTDRAGRARAKRAGVVVLKTGRRSAGARRGC